MSGPLCIEIPVGGEFRVGDKLFRCIEWKAEERCLKCSMCFFDDIYYSGDDNQFYYENQLVFSDDGENVYLQSGIYPVDELDVPCQTLCGYRQRKDRKDVFYEEVSE